jgi:F0F1-type ATP synthase assembly protein I
MDSAHIIGILLGLTLGILLIIKATSMYKSYRNSQPTLEPLSYDKF